MKIVVALVIISFIAVGGAFWVRPELPHTAFEYFAKPTVTPTPSFSTQVNGETLFKKSNEWRVSQNQTQYIKDERLCIIAKDHVMNENLEDLRQKYKNFPSAFSENLGKGSTEEIVFNTWLRLPEEKENLTKPYVYSCAFCNDGYCAQVFSNLEYGGWEESKNIWKSIKMRSDNRGCCSWSQKEASCNPTTHQVICGDGQESSTCKC